MKITAVASAMRVMLVRGDDSDGNGDSFRGMSECLVDKLRDRVPVECVSNRMNAIGEAS